MFVRTQNDEKVEVKHMSFVSVEPDDISTNIWKLLVSTYSKIRKQMMLTHHLMQRLLNVSDGMPLNI